MEVATNVPKEKKGSNDWKNSQLTVAVRIRPMTTSEIEMGSSFIAHTIDDSVVVLLDPMEDPDDILRANRSREKHYAFDRCFGEHASQEEVYQQTAKCLIQSVVQGYNATVFAYGATGAGKTYTMLGTDYEPGIMARALNDLFDAMDAKSEDSVYKVTMSYLEIYNEMIRDLLNPTSGYLDLREDASGNVQVAGISEVSTVSTNEVMSLLMEGNKERTQEPTAANKTSSRSHAVLQVTVKERNRVRSTSQKIRIGKLFMIDLAGSERASQTKNRGKRMIEGAHINRSLLALGNCINALVEGGKYVNYRDSKLTRILKDALGGNCKTVMIATISPASILFEESRNTLMYADRAKNIKMKVRQNLTNVTHHMIQYTNIITELRQEIVRLQKKIADQNQLKESSHSHEVKSEETLHHRQEMDQLRQQLMVNFQEQMDIRQRMMEVENRKWEVAVLINRQMSVITEWEQERSRSKEISKEMDNRYKELDQEKEMDALSTTSDSPEPGEIINAREEIAVLVGQQNKLVSSQKELEGRLNDVRRDANKLEEILPKKITSEEQGEILSMLCKVHELEIENTELKSQALIHKHTTEQKEMMIRRFEKHRQLSDKIIQQQRSLINKHGIFRPQQLEDWYDQYTSAVFDEMTVLSTNPNLQGIQDIKATSMLNLKALKALQEGSDETYPEKESADVKLRPKKAAQSPEDVSNQPRVFNPSPRAHQLRQKSDFGSFPKIKLYTSSPAAASTPVTKHESLEMLSGHNKQASSPADILKTKSMHDLEISDSDPDILSDKKELIQRTKKIAAIAAQKRNSQKQFEKISSRPEKLNLHEKTIISLKSVYEVSEPDTEGGHLTMSELSKHNHVHNTRSSDHNNDDNISIITVDRRSEGTDTHSNMYLKTSKHKMGADGGRKRMTDKQIADKRRRRGLGYESSGHVSYMPSKGGYNRAYPAIESHRSQSKRILPKSTAEAQQIGKVKYPIVHHAGEQDVTTLGSRSTPTSMNVVHQAGVDMGKGQTLYKRTKGPVTHDASNRSTPQLIGNKQSNSRQNQPAYPVYQRKNQLAVSGFSVARRERIRYRKM